MDLNIRGYRYKLFPFTDVKMDIDHNYMDTRDRLLYSLMQCVVDYVEVENAMMYLFCFSDAKKELSLKDKIFYYLPLPFRSAKLGMKYLEEEIKTDDVNDFQRIRAEVTLEVYKWWKLIRPYRQDPYTAFDEPLVTPIINKVNLDLPFTEVSYTEEESKLLNEHYSKINELETKYDKEDNEMMHKIINIRLSMWV